MVSNGSVTLDSILANGNLQAANIIAQGSVTLLGSLYTNQFNNSNGDSSSLYIRSTAGSVTLNKFTANNNNGGGVEVSSSGKLTIADAVTSLNRYEGVYGSSAGASITNLSALNNGSGANGSGIHLILSSGTASFAKSSFAGNTGHGIWVEGSGYKPVVTITSTTYYGNDTDRSGDKNFFVDQI